MRSTITAPSFALSAAAPYDETARSCYAMLREPAYLPDDKEKRTEWSLYPTRSSGLSRCVASVPRTFSLLMPCLCTIYLLCIPFGGGPLGTTAGIYIGSSFPLGLLGPLTDSILPGGIKRRVRLCNKNYTVQIVAWVSKEKPTIIVFMTVSRRRAHCSQAILLCKRPWKRYSYIIAAKDARSARKCRRA